MNRRRGVAVASLVAATLFWAGNYIVGAAAVETIDPLSLLLLRWVLAAVPLLVLAALLERPHWVQLLRAWPWLAILSAFGMLGYNLFLYAALQFTDAFSASLINAFNPALISLAAVMFLGARLNTTAVLGIGLALVGVLVVLSDGDFSALMSTGFGAGEVLMCAAILSWTAYTIIGRRAPALPPITSTACQAVLTIGVLTPVAATTGGVTWPGSSHAWWAMGFIALFPTVLSYLLWNHALSILEPARAGVFVNLITVFTAAFALLTGHSISVGQIIGGVIVLIGVALTNIQTFRRTAPPPAKATATQPAREPTTRPTP